MRAERTVLAAVALGTILAPLNSTMIAVALPHVMDEFDADVATAGWLVTGYLIALAALQPVAGKLGDRVGRRPLILGGLAAFGLASLGAALAPSLPVLVLFRVLQAVAGAIMLPNGVALLREVVPARRRGARFGLVGSAIGVAASVGPAFGGLVIGAAGWRAIFYVNVPFVVAALVLAWRSVPRLTATRVTGPFDLLGSLLLCGVLAGAAGLLVEGRESAGAPLMAGSAIALGAALVYLLRYELRHADPVIHPRLFAIRPFAAATSGVALSNLSFYTTLLATPILLADEIGWDPVETGLALTVLSGPTILVAPLGGRLGDRLGHRIPAVAGHALATAGLVPLALGADAHAGALLGCLAVAGVGFALSMAPLQTSAVEAVEPAQAGVASGLFSTSRYLGSIVGSMALAALLVSTDAGVTGFGAVAVLVVVSALLAAAASAGLDGRRRIAGPEPASASGLA